MKNLTIILLLAVGTFMSSCTDAQTTDNENVTTGEIKTVNVAEFEKLIGANTGLLLDVRTIEEHQSGNIEGSKLIDVTDGNFEKNIEALDKDVPVMVYCRSGGRSMRAAKILKSKGFKTIYNLDGGFGAWSSKH